MSKSDTVANRKRLLDYIALVRYCLRMDNWDIVLAEGNVDPEEESHAVTWAHENHHVINIQIAADFFDLEPDGVRNTIIHELVHALHRDANRAVEKATTEGKYLPPALADELHTEYMTQMERMVAWVADRLEATTPQWDPTVKVPRELPRGCYLHKCPK